MSCAEAWGGVGGRSMAGSAPSGLLGDITSLQVKQAGIFVLLSFLFGTPHLDFLPKTENILD